ncbi:MAG: hypothetical protein KDE51_26905, partial [Anaerolineales bacterium]|nr:hypothetical protein [Anaerolineales bacterium]
MQATTQKIWQRWVTWRDGSDNGRIFQAMLIVGGGTLVVNLTAFLRELAIAYQFGTSDELDAFIIAFMIPLFTISMIPGSLNPAFVPAYVNIKETQGEEAAARLAGNILSSTLILTACVTAVLIAVSEYLLPAVASNFSEGKLALTLRLFYILQPILLIRAVVDLLRGVLNSQDRFALPAMAPALIYLVPTILIFISGNVFLLAIGTLVGYTLQAILLWVTVARKNIKIRWQRPRLNHELKSFWGQYLPAVFGSLIMGSSNLIDQTMATWSGSGSVASLGYGQRVTTFVVGIAVMAVGTAVLPNFSKMIAENRVQEIKRTLSFYTVVLFTSTIVAVGGLWWFSEPITRILFERGAFTAADTAVVS